MYSGRLVKIKGVDILLKAAKKYEKDDILTLIVGGGILNKKLQEQALELNLKNVIFLGNKPQILLNKLYNIADVTVLCSRYEAFGLVVVESLACGTPVVVSDLDTMKDFMKEDFGVFFEKENPESLAEGIIKIINNKEKYNREKISKYIKENYSEKVIIKDLTDVYKSCL